MAIHPTAIISKKAEIGRDVEIGPYAIVEEQVKIGDRTFIDAHAKICKYTTLGHDCKVCYCAVVGDMPQDISYDPGVRSYTTIGSGTTIREFVTIHRSPKEEFTTVVGKNCMLMAFVHLAHDVTIGDKVVIVNHSGLSGHVSVESGAIISGYNLFHQFTRVGTLAMIGPGNKINLDIPPYCMLGEPGVIYGPNTIGLRRAGFSPEKRAAIRKAIKTYFFKGLSKSDAIEEIEKEEMTPEVEHFVEFIKASKRGIVSITPKHLNPNNNSD